MSKEVIFVARVLTPEEAPHPTLYHNLHVQRLLGGLVDRMVGDTGFQEDMLQEALIHLWRLEERRPGQSLAWYLQGCRYHIQNWLRLGRSVDSVKRSSACVLDAAADDDSEELLAQLGIDSLFWDEVSANDIISLLSGLLDSQQREVLFCLVDGLSARETAKRLNASHTWVGKCRRKIAVLALEVGLAPHGKRAESPSAPDANRTGRVSEARWHRQRNSAAGYRK
jgi:DNA-directed RNA polymerase specialized sigma24 family protein